MSISLKTLADRFNEHRRAFYESGGKPKALKYSEALRVAAAHFHLSAPDMSMATLARDLGVGLGSLKGWCDTRLDGQTVAPFFVAVDVEPQVAVAQRADRTNHRVTFTLREITVDLGERVEGPLALAVIAAMRNTGGGVC